MTVRDRTDTRQVWNIRVGPCWCGGRPGQSGSFDLLRWRISHLGQHDVTTNLVIATVLIPRHAGAALTQAIASSPSPWRVITHRICPMVAERVALQSSDMVEVADITTVHTHLPFCVADQPERLAVAMLSNQVVDPTGDHHRMVPL